MNKLLKLASAGGLLTALVFSASAGAAVVTSMTGTAVPLPGVNAQGPGPEVVTSTIDWGASNPDALFGYTGGYGLASNGVWNGAPMVGTNGGNDSMSFMFSSAVKGFGGLLNYAPGYGQARIAIYDASDVLLESFDLNISTPNATNGGAFYGFVRDTADISRFTLSEAYIVGRDFVVQEAASDVPEPASLALLGLGLAGVAGARRKARRS
ncbi:hypothetical protein SRABI118_04105 [Massilia sp. Bi118]|uniref:PEP-CTERM sorting domain-containing protein n=1 Tax=Massilia sp. Bi118 TaxID=2822346 RepID=UPI001DE8D640|nr:PEP-CTERM sorting domain-containing protein [Massilia sp. Bi118]CAH0292051.1 hypothetical protein SRABI118_04105 [Massilia sp. Bi118]